MMHSALWISLCIVILTCDAALDKTSNKLADLKAVENLKPLKAGENVFFWRPQKVGSSTLLSILMSYGYRYNFLPKRKSASNAYCRRFAKCAIAHENYTAYNVSYTTLEKYVTQKIPGSPAKGHLKKKDLDAEKASNAIEFKISLSHEICNIKSTVISETMPCSFLRLPEPSAAADTQPLVRELFMLRDPVSRAISAYYFWGELYKMKYNLKASQRDKTIFMQKERDAKFSNRNLLEGKGEIKLGQSDWKDPLLVHGQHFQYHGQESSAPPPQIALRYANTSVYKPGMPGPSYTWSLFADNVQDALQIVQSDRICTIVLERLSESLVVAAHYLGWSLADVVVTKHRKALSSHPKAADWPAEAVHNLRAQLDSPEHGEYLLYNASVAKLDQRIGVLKSRGVDVPAEVVKLQALQRRVTEICLDDTYLLHYRNTIKKAKLPPHPSQNKLRDVEEKYVENGHMFSFNREILMSFDVCGPCEAHAMLLSVEKGLADSIETALPLAKLDRKHTEGNVNFAKCPTSLS